MEFLDLYNIFVNEIAGSEILFLLISLAVIAYLAARLRFPNGVALMILGVFILLTSAFMKLLFPVTLLFIGIFFGYQLTRLFKG
ncbi:MAG: hypothetical protein DRO04_02255 [Candidatus Iainarchaeum archaeon]|uniref:Uncharacterized protein n=1 Tax=Candidatus Iainarchaeum sp. TaxID=3101447 RepID=A0A497JJN2_9ARCH|nr:MAG: hypothetical protein DRO04_02255 [Candidatus Diapherotrites archaeon]